MIKAVKKIWMQMIGKAYRKIRTFLRIKKNPVTEDAVKQLYPFRDNERCYEEYEIKNIYDLAGNVAEWTMESYGTTQKVVRGGQSGGTDTVTFREASDLDAKSGQIGFRVALYL